MNDDDSGEVGKAHLQIEILKRIWKFLKNILHFYEMNLVMIQIIW